MATPTLIETKEFLRVEVDYFDGEIELMLQGAIHHAENMTGRNYTNPFDAETYEDMPAEVAQAVLMDVATGFSNRQNNTEDNEKEAVNASIYAYRQNSKKPMF